MLKYLWQIFLLILVISLPATEQLFALSQKSGLSPQSAESFWSELSQNFAIDYEEKNPKVQKHIKWYLQHPNHLHQVLKSSEVFIQYVYTQTQRKNLPAELALIPLLESQYNPAIGSRSGAAGLWQMMPGTANKFGLKINHTYDGRKDVSASTKAALNYLSYLYHYFNKDWLLALAAYDAGEGKVKMTLHGKHLKFWQLPLSKETKEYVPKLLAIASIIKQSKNYKVNLPAISNQNQLQELIWNEAKAIDLTETAKNLGLDDHTLRYYNPGFRKNIANVSGSVTLLVPGKSESNLNTISVSENEISERKAISLKNSKDEVVKKKSIRKKRPQYKKYKIHSGDSLSRIAKKFHTTVKKLKANNRLNNEKKLRIGQSLLIPRA